MQLTKALPKDIHELQEICIAAYTKNFSSHWNEGGLKWYIEKEYSKARLTADVTDKNIDYFFVRLNRKNVGFIKIGSTTLANLSAESCTELEKIYMLPECKGLGIGKAALLKVIELIEKRGKQYLFLSVIDTNESAISFYKKLGFKFHSKTSLDVPYFKEELKGMDRMIKTLNDTTSS